MFISIRPSVVITELNESIHWEALCCHCAESMCGRGLSQRRLRLPYVRDGLFVLVVRGPHCDFVPFGAHVNDGSAHVIAEVIKSFAHQTQKLQEEQLAGQNTCCYK